MRHNDKKLLMHHFRTKNKHDTSTNFESGCHILSAALLVLALARARNSGVKLQRQRPQLIFCLGLSRHCFFGPAQVALDVKQASPNPQPNKPDPACFRFLATCADLISQRFACNTHTVGGLFDARNHCRVHLLLEAT